MVQDITIFTMADRDRHCWVV